MVFYTSQPKTFNFKDIRNFIVYFFDWHQGKFMFMVVNEVVVSAMGKKEYLVGRKSQNVPLGLND